MSSDPLAVSLLCEEGSLSMFEEFISSDLELKATNSLEKLIDQLDNHVVIILLQDSLILDDLEGILDNLNLLHVKSHKIIYNDILKPNEVLMLFNKNKISKSIHPDFSIEQKKQIIEMTVEDYLKNQHLHISEPENLETVSEDMLLDLSLQLADLSDNNQMEDFSNQFFAMIQGLQSLVTMNYRIYLDKSSGEGYLTNVFGYLSDLELLANQYDQKILMIYVEMVRAYLYILKENIMATMNHFKNGIRIFYWLSSEFIDNKLVKIINSFPIQEDEFYYFKAGKKDFVLNKELEGQITSQLQLLMNYDLSKLINLSENLYRNLNMKSEEIQSIMIVDQSLPIFVQAVNTMLDPTLVSGFVEALSTFLMEITDGKGDIDHILHDKGVILIHREDHLRYLLIAKSDEVYMRMGLRQLAKATIDQIREIPSNETLYGELRVNVENQIKNIFRVKLPDDH